MMNILLLAILKLLVNFNLCVLVARIISSVYSMYAQVKLWSSVEAARINYVSFSTQIIEQLFLLSVIWKS